MFISKVSEISDVGIYRNFSWPEELPEFSNFNLIFGWNYSGKTTLSRVFDCLGKPELLPSLKGSFIVKDKDGVHYRSEELPPSQHCKVFNRYFIDRNFQQEHNAPAVFIVGDDAVEIRNRISVLEMRSENVTKAQQHFVIQKGEWEKRINDGLKRNEARSIGELVSERSFNRRNLDALIEEVKGSVDSHILESTDFDAQKATACSSDEFSKQNDFKIPSIEISELIDEVNMLLTQTASNNAIENLKENPALEAWVRKGREIHATEDKCGFCGNEIELTRLELLKGHFSTEYEALIKAVKDQVNTLDRLIIQFTLPEQNQLIHSVRDEFSEVRGSISSFVTNVETVVPILIESLNNKISSIEAVHELDLSDLPIEEIQGFDHAQVSKKINELLTQHNDQISDIEATKKIATDNIKRHLAALFYKENDIAIEELNYSHITGKITQANNIQGAIQTQIQLKESEIRQHSIAVAKLNELIGIILTGSKISAVQLSESEFEFRRGSEPAIHLSDGERTAIAFAYFLLTLEEGSTDLSSLLVFIDDPISSLDSNHIYAIYALISDRLKDKVNQLFISTHNYEFLNLLKDEALNRNKNFPAGCSGYLTQRAYDDQGEPFSELVEMPKALRKYKSEYQLIFSMLYDFMNSTNATLQEAYASPTILRKFLEAYLGFRKPIAGRWSGKLDLLFESDTERKEIAKFADDASHLQSFQQVVEHSAFIASAKEIVKKVIDAVEKTDPAHFEGLKTIVEN